MTDFNEIEGELKADGFRFTILATRFNGFIVEHLIEGALDTLRRHGAKDSSLELIRIPGAFELPLVASTAAKRKTSDAMIALACVIRGATPHFEYVAGECVKGMATSMMQHEIPVAFGVLTVDTIEQAIERAGTKSGNKGWSAAMAAVEMANLIEVVDQA